MGELAVVEKKNSTFAEEIKKIRTNLKFSSLGKEIKVICVTSSLPGEGKSMVSGNLAAAFAQADEKVLIIDCDLRKGRQRHLFHIPSSKGYGLSNLIINKNWKEEYKKYIKDTKIENLSLIPTGPYPPNPSELLANENFVNLLEVLKKEYSVIILDCPPVSGLNDALVVSTYADTTIIVVKHKKTQMHMLEETKKQLESVGSKIGGVVINNMEFGKSKSSYYYYGGYYKAQ